MHANKYIYVLNDLSPSRKRADGGSGGRGGNVYLVADRSVNSLNFATTHFNAQDATNGTST
jgi:GTPase involved in cell partitioning and DNA repair